MSDGNGTSLETTTPGSARRGILLVLAGSFFISFAAFFVKGAPIDSTAVAFYRFLFGCAALFAVAAVKRIKLLPPRPLVPLIALAGLFFVGDVLIWHKSIVRLGPGIATIVVNFEVIFLAVYGVIFLKERMSLQQKASIPLALLGLALLLGVHIHGLPEHLAIGTGLALTASLFYTGYVLVLRRSQMVPEKIHPIANMAWLSLVSLAATLAICLAFDVPLGIPDARTLGTLAALGICCQSTGWVLISLGLPAMTPFRAGILMLTQPAMAFLWDSFAYGTATGLHNILGAALAIFAIGMGMKGPAKKETPE